MMSEGIYVPITAETTDFSTMMDETGKLTDLGRRWINDALEVLGEAALRNTKAHGFDLDRPFSEDIALIHSEASEALEEWRKGADVDHVWHSSKYGIRVEGGWVEVDGPAKEHNDDGSLNKPEGVRHELADVIIRTVQSARYHGLEIGRAVTHKHEYNAGRPFKHGKIA